MHNLLCHVANLILRTAGTKRQRAESRRESCANKYLCRQAGTSMADEAGPEARKEQETAICRHCRPCRFHCVQARGHLHINVSQEVVPQEFVPQEVVSQEASSSAFLGPFPSLCSSNISLEARRPTSSCPPHWLPPLRTRHRRETRPTRIMTMRIEALHPTSTRRSVRRTRPQPASAKTRSKTRPSRATTSSARCAIW